MLEVADVFRQHAAAYRAHHALLPSQSRALEDLEHCRTAFFGGHLAQCDHCGHLRYSYHSCRNRHCPKCHGEQTQAWLDKQQEQLLPCPHYLLTFTVPAALRPLAYAHQRDFYGILLRSAAHALLKLAADPRYLGATPTVLAVLHTWTRALLHHPHAHLLVSAGGLDPDGRWLQPKNPAFLVPVRALAVIFRAKVRDALRQTDWGKQIPAALWHQPWVVHCQPAGAGQKVLDYLARYVFRVAISNSRLESLQDGQVTFRYRDNRTQQMRRVSLPPEEFIRRFLQHVLPQGFQKVRHYGLGAANQADRRQLARAQLARSQRPQTGRLGNSWPTAAAPTLTPARLLPYTAPLCPACRQGRLLVIQILPPQRKVPP
jgi:hypothetical protein